MRVVLLGLAFLAVASSMHIPTNGALYKADHKRFLESLVDKVKDLLPSQEDIDKLKETIKDKLEDAKDTIKDKYDDAKDKLKDVDLDKIKDSLKDKFEDAKDKLKDVDMDKLKDSLKDKLEGAQDKLKDVKSQLDDAKDKLKEKIDGAKDSLVDKYNDAKDQLKDAFAEDDEKSEQKRMFGSWLDKIKEKVEEILPSQSDIDKLKGQIDGVFPAISDAAAGDVKKLFKTVEDQTKTVTQFKDLFDNLDDEDKLVDSFSKMYKFEDKDGKHIGIKSWVSNAVAKVQEYYKDYVPADIMQKINEVKEAAADKDDKRRLPKAVLKLFVELLQMVGLLVINYAIGLPV